MPDFDANDDPLRLSDSAKEEPLEMPKLRPRFAPRARTLAYGQCFVASRPPAQRLRRRLATGRWRASSRACPSTRAGLPATRLARRRRLWTTCHGRAPGSPS